MKRPAIFFDRDNTLIASDGYLGDPARVTLVEGAALTVARARQLGFAVVVFSNQSGVARGMFSEDDVRAVNARIDELLREANPEAVVDRHEFCPYHPQATVAAYCRESDLRKPGPGMIYAAAQSLALDLSKSWVIGDAARDIEAGHAAGLRTVLFTDPRLPASPAAATRSRVAPERTVSTLGEAMDYISQARHRDPPASPRIESPPGSADADEEPPPPQRPAMQSDPSTKLQAVAEQILQEVRRQNEHAPIDFSVSKLLAGIAQVISLAVVFAAYLYRNETTAFLGLLIFAVWIQCVTVALLVMERK
jgi:D-glycero-D-manno-heptose 1,7-bisphosphate phosphatase